VGVKEFEVYLYQTPSLLVKEKRFASTDILKPLNQWWAKAKLITSLFNGLS
jgi:hypothetical protein